MKTNIQYQSLLIKIEKGAQNYLNKYSHGKFLMHGQEGLERARGLMQKIKEIENDIDTAAGEFQLIKLLRSHLTIKKTLSDYLRQAITNFAQSENEFLNHLQPLFGSYYRDVLKETKKIGYIDLNNKICSIAFDTMIENLYREMAVKNRTLHVENGYELQERPH
ncbi:MAG: hypothetical protein A3F12_01025 [Gammaproteobacteria bacterium RIFCSPHIGHO2_12_FULL_38_14]|nr:MAG: hypothetical protein A3F12_01025 [Gammaproteobacteria bacterium RIFCSPHIGHO2_12_FULL_38_14]